MSLGTESPLCPLRGTLLAGLLVALGGCGSGNSPADGPLPGVDGPPVDAAVSIADAPVADQAAADRPARPDLPAGPDLAAAADLVAAAADSAPRDAAIGPRDAVAPAADLAVAPDLAKAAYTPATIHQIDVDPGNGPFGQGKLVVLDRVVAVTKVDKYVNSLNQQCRYQIWVQDPTCMVPPCGLVVKAIGPMAPAPDSTGKDCPAARLTATPLANVDRDDNLRIRGRLVFEVDSDPPNKVVEHQLFVDSLDALPNAVTIQPKVITDPQAYSQFVAHTGTGWALYEGMLLTLQPSLGTLQVSAITKDGFRTIPGGADWDDTFDGDYIPGNLQAYPTIGSTFKAITGVASARHGGGLMPRRTKDFVP